MLFLIPLFLIQAARAQDPLDIMRRALEHDRINFESRKNYTYQQREEDREFDAHGKLSKSESETNEVLILAGRPYERVIARNDKPLSESEARKEQEKMDREIARRQRMTSSEAARMDKERQEERQMLREVPDAFELRLTGVENISGKPTWVIDAEPRPGFRPKDSRANLLSKLRARVWIDQAEYQWVKADVQVLQPISFGLGIFRVDRGGSLSYEQTRVNDEVWLPTYVHIRGDARIGYVKKTRAEIAITVSDYKKFQADSRIVAAEAK